MTIPTSRARGYAEILIDHERCNVCGTCVDVCNGYPLYIEDGRLMVDQKRGFGCIACGACVAVCPSDAIRIDGRDLSPEDVFAIPPTSSRTRYKQFQSLLLARRSIRNFKKEEVDPEIVRQILEAASTAPVGIPPSDVGVLVFQTREAVGEVRGRLLTEMLGWRWMFSPFIMALMRPFIGKENAAMYKDFIGPAIEEYARKDKEGKDWFFYDAPLAIYFYGTLYNDPADTTIPATLAMLAGESLGLGTCILGFPGFIFQYSRKLRKLYHLPEKIQPGLVVIFGYPEYSNHNSIKRRFREISFFGKS